MHETFKAAITSFYFDRAVLHFTCFIQAVLDLLRVFGTLLMVSFT